MALQNYSSLNELHMDVLKEICNIGSGNAANALSQMIGVPVDIEVPEIAILEANEVMEKLGGAKNVMTGLTLDLMGDVNGVILLLLYRDFVSMLLNTLMFIEINDFNEIDEIGFSALNETANIVAGSFVNAISAMTSMTIDISPPSAAVDTVGKIMKDPVVVNASTSGKFLLIENRFVCCETNTRAHILIAPDMCSLEQLITSLGIDV